MNPTAALADVVLPVASCFEREALKIGFEISAESQSLVQFRRAAVPPPGTARSDTDIVFDLARRLGLAEQFFGGSIEAADHAKHSKRDANGDPSGFPTRSRKVEFWSEIFLERGYPALPAFIEPTEKQPAIAA